ncbi:MAG: hypothetical protein ABEK01_01355 [Candidatus Nanohaloarchaea archaeon]
MADRKDEESAIRRIEQRATDSEKSLKKMIEGLEKEKDKHERLMKENEQILQQLRESLTS